MLPSLGLLILRLGFAVNLIALHGLEKARNVFDRKIPPFPDPIGIGSETGYYLVAFAETLAPLAVAAGFLTRLAALPTAFAMGVAVFAFHLDKDDAWKDMEKAILYLVMALALVGTGAGRFSLDATFKGRKSRSVTS